MASRGRTSEPSDVSGRDIMALLEASTGLSQPGPCIANLTMLSRFGYTNQIGGVLNERLTGKI